MIQQLIDQHLSAITAQIRAKYPSEMESYAKRLINLGMDADQVEEDMQAVLRTLVMRNESVSDEEFFYILNLFPDYEQFGKQTIEFKITLEGTKSWRKVRLPAILSLTELAYAAIAAFHGMGGHLFTLKLNDKHKEAIKSAKILMVDGNELEAALQAAKLARGNGVSVLYDAGGLYEGVEQLLRYTDILIPSEEFAISHTQEENVFIAAKKLYNLYHPKVVVITRGKQGGLLYDGSDFTVYPVYPARVVDSNGAGDVFHGAFAAGLISGYGYEQCCHFASAVSALKCTGMGARESVPTRSKVMEFLRRNGYAI